MHRVFPPTVRPFFRGLTQTLAICLLAAAGGALLTAAPVVGAQGTPAPGSRPPALPQATQWLQDYLRIDTTNPPGNEAAAVGVLADLLHSYGHSTRQFVSPNGRASLLAKVEATAKSPAASEPLLLLHHIDVVPAGEGWSRDPFAGEIVDGVLYGRGAIDSKSLGIAHLVSFLELAQQPESLTRDLWYLASADEEAGGSEGVGWIFERYPETLEAVGAVLTEAGANRVVDGKPAWWGIEIGQKRPLWLALETKGRGGHGSSFHPASATHQMLRALDRVLSIDPQLHLSQPAFLHFKALVPFQGSGFDQLFDQPTLEQARRQLALAVAENRLHRTLLPGMQNSLLDTIQVTTIGNGSTSVNVVPAKATATLDIRLLPDTDDEAFLAQLHEALGDHVDLEVLLRSDQVPDPDINEETYRLLQTFLSTSAPVIPTFIAGTTDARYFRERGIPAYGFSPFLLSGLEARGIHGPNESIPVQRFLEGVERMTSAVRALVTIGVSESP